MSELDPARLRQLQRVGTLCGFAAGAWLGAAEAPTKLVTLGVSPVLISFMMVLGVFLARWSVPALIRGTATLTDDVRQAPHLLVWAVLGGCLWAVANTLTVYAIRDLGLAIAFPLWNSNSLLGILWGTLLFNELRDAGRARRFAVLGGAAVMFVGGALLADASASHATASGYHATSGIIAALTAGALWGTMYIPYRKAYLTGMHPLSFIAFFTIGELVMMTVLALVFVGGPAEVWREIVASRAVLFWLLVAGFVWVVGDLFQQYAAKYVGISRGIPLSNTNQLWGLLWGMLVFGELASGGRGAVIAGSLLMAAGAGAIAFASAPGKEYRRWQEAGARESARYGVDPSYVAARMAGDPGAPRGRHTLLDWLLVLAATAVFVGSAMVAAVPALQIGWGWAAALTLAIFGMLVAGGVALWRATRFG